jgi:pimeloyl-ACP methyl ester carboxylesterase
MSSARLPKFNFRVPLALPLFALIVACALNVPGFTNASGNECALLFERASLPASGIGLQNFIAKSVQVDARTVYYEHLPAAPGKGTAIMFIGIYTPIVDFVQFKAAFAARSRGEGLVMMSYDSMPDSLSAAKMNRSSTRAPGAKVTLMDMVVEGTAIVNDANIQGSVAVVGYSFGAAPASSFAAFHRSRVTDLIFTAPLVYNGEHSAQSTNGLAALAAMAVYNPFFGTAIVETAREQGARAYAEKFIYEHFDSRGNPEKVDRRVVVEGLAGRIRATENFDLRKQDFSLLPQPHFILGENEHPLRLRAQTEVVKSAIAAAGGKLDRLPTVTRIAGGGHVVLGTSPIESADAIIDVLRKREAQLRGR